MENHTKLFKSMGNVHEISRKMLKNLQDDYQIKEYAERALPIFQLLKKGNTSQINK